MRLYQKSPKPWIAFDELNGPNVIARRIARRGEWDAIAEQLIAAM